MPDTKPALSRAQLKQQADAANRHLHDASGSSSVAEAVAKAVRNEFRTDFQGFREDKQLARVELEAKIRKQQFEELQCLVTLAETAEEANDARSRLKQLICSPMPSLQNSIPSPICKETLFYPLNQCPSLHLSQKHAPLQIMLHHQ